MRISEPPRKTIHPTSVTPKGVTPSPWGEGSSLRRFLRMKFVRIGACLAPTLNNQLPTAPHPATRKGGHLPPGEGHPREVGTLLPRPTVHPLSQSFGLTAPPTQGSQRHAVRFYRPSSVFASQIHLPPGEGESQKNERPPEAFASGGSRYFFTHSPTNNARNRSLFPGGCKFSAPGGSDRRPTHN